MKLRLASWCLRRWFLALLPGVLVMMVIVWPDANMVKIDYLHTTTNRWGYKTMTFCMTNETDRTVPTLSSQLRIDEFVGHDWHERGSMAESIVRPPGPPQLKPRSGAQVSVQDVAFMRRWRLRLVLGNSRQVARWRVRLGLRFENILCRSATGSIRAGELKKYLVPRWSTGIPRRVDGQERS